MRETDAWRIENFLVPEAPDDFITAGFVANNLEGTVEERKQFKIFIVIEVLNESYSRLHEIDISSPTNLKEMLGGKFDSNVHTITHDDGKDIRCVPQESFHSIHHLFEKIIFEPFKPDILINFDSKECSR